MDFQWTERFRKVVCFTCYAVTAGLVVNITITSRAFHNHDRATLHDMVYGTAFRPFVYRALTPLTIRLLTQATPEFIKNKILSAWQHTDRYRNLTIANGYQPGNEVEYLYTLLIMYFALVGIALVMRSLLMWFYPKAPPAADFAPILLLLALPLFVSYFMYDYPNLFLFSLCILLLFQKKWLPLCLLFPLACLSKETALLIPIALVCMYGRETFASPLRIPLAILTLTWIAVTSGLRVIYADNPGIILEFHLLEYNLPLLVSPTKWLQFDAFFQPRGMNILMLGIIIALVMFRWQQKPILLRRAIGIVFPLFLISFAFGRLDEMRMYYELLAVIFPLMVGGIIGLYTKGDESQSQTPVIDLREQYSPTLDQKQSG